VSQNARRSKAEQDLDNAIAAVRQDLIEIAKYAATLDVDEMVSELDEFLGEDDFLI